MGEASKDIFQLGVGGVRLVLCHCDGLVGGTFEDERRLLFTFFVANQKTAVMMISLVALLSGSLLNKTSERNV